MLKGYKDAWMSLFLIHKLHWFQIARFQIMHALKTNIKTDISKAYDKVEWNFLESAMEVLGFERRCIQLIMVCVKSISYSVLMWSSIWLFHTNHGY